MNGFDQHATQHFTGTVLRRFLPRFGVSFFVAATLLSFGSCKGTGKSPDDKLSRYAAAYNAQARQIMPLSEALESFNADYNPQSHIFSITVDFDSSFIRTEKIDEAHVRSRLIRSFGDEDLNPDASLPSVMDEAGACLRFTCTSTGSDTVCVITMHPDDFR